MNGLNYLYELGLKKQLILNTEEFGTVYMKLDGREDVHKFPYEVYFNPQNNNLKQMTCEALMSLIPNKKNLGRCSCQTNEKGVRSLIKKIISDYKIIPGFSLDFETIKNIDLLI